MAIFAPTSGDVSQAQKSATKMDVLNVHKTPTHPQILIPCLHSEMQVQSPRTDLEMTLHRCH